MKKVVVITSYPPRPCGIATYSQDLIKTMQRVSSSFEFIICALENGKSKYRYGKEVKYILDTTRPDTYHLLAEEFNTDDSITTIYVQHEFGLFGGDLGSDLLLFLYTLNKPIVVTFHSVLPNPVAYMRTVVKAITLAAEQIIVMTNSSKQILMNDYQVDENQINIIPHGIHEINHLDRAELKKKYRLSGKIVFSTFGLINEGKSIETALDAMPAIIDKYPNCVFLVLGQTHPEIVKREGERYRDSLVNKVNELGIRDHVVFVNKYLSLDELLEYLQLTDIYLFTSKDPLQAVSGTFAYALSAGCPIVSTPIPHAKEVLTEDVGKFFDFKNSEQLAAAVVQLLHDPQRLEQMRLNALQKMYPAIWSNTALSHLLVFKKAISIAEEIEFNLPQPDSKHLKAMTTQHGIVQFAKLTVPDMDSGYTLDDNARALIASCLLYNQDRGSEVLRLIPVYLNFIHSCQQATGRFINYIDRHGEPHIINRYTNLEDANGRAIWALGHFINYKPKLLAHLEDHAMAMIERTLPWVDQLQSPRAIAFTIKGFRLYNKAVKRDKVTAIIKKLADKLLYCFDQASNNQWQWFEPYLTYGNAVIPEGMLLAWLETGITQYRNTAKATFDFLLSQTFVDDKIRVVSNRGWRHKDQEHEVYGEQPIDVAYTILALHSFKKVFPLEHDYSHRIYTALTWFYGRNHLNRYVYSIASGGCHDGLEKSNVNLNQGAESTTCYLMARCVAEEHLPDIQSQIDQLISYNAKRNLPRLISRRPD